MRPFVIFLLSLLPVAAAAQNPICAPTGEIVAAAVEARKAGQGAEAAKAGIAAGLDSKKAGYAPAVPHIVDWVYTLSEADLQKDVAGSWIMQCEAR
ncbi:MAG: DNA primase [Roseovarius sp.]|nr:DNA primase [Roseovarius sp.]